MLRISELIDLYTDLISNQCFKDQCMLLDPGLDGLEFDPGSFPMFSELVYVVSSWAG